MEGIEKGANGVWKVGANGNDVKVDGNEEVEKNRKQTLTSDHTDTTSPYVSDRLENSERGEDNEGEKKVLEMWGKGSGCTEEVTKGRGRRIGDGKKEEFVRLERGGGNGRKDGNFGQGGMMNKGSR
ncbi:hypothetical protein Tco_0739887, partial [Tanacetum coccineum]